MHLGSVLNVVSNTAIYMISMDGTIQSWNTGAANIFGFSEAEVVGTNFRQFYSQEDLDSKLPEREIRDAIANGGTNLEGWRIAKGKRRFFAQASLSPILDEKGEIASLVKVVLDNTTRKLSEETMQAAEQYLQAIMQATVNTAIYTISTEGIVQSWNKGAANIFGYNEQEAVGRDFRDFYEEEDLKTRLPDREIGDACKLGGVNLEGWRLGKNNRRFFAQASLAPIFDTAGNVVQLVKVVLDNTARKRSEDKVLAQKKEMFELSIVINRTTARLSDVASELSSSTALTTKLIADTAATVAQVTETADRKNQETHRISEEARIAVETARQGEEATTSALTGMNRIREQMDSIALAMSALSQQTTSIVEIIASVDDLAQQSNLLALNASIEAAKAGEHGKGFAVVAQEVKKLSQQSKSATTNVRALLNDIVKAARAATQASKQGKEVVEVGHVQASEAGSVIKALSQSIEKSADATQQMGVASQQQLLGMKHIAEVMETIKSASLQNLESTAILENSGKELGELTLRLERMNLDGHETN